MMESVPFAARRAPPETGASMKEMSGRERVRLDWTERA